MINKIVPFKFWCQKVLPLVYDDALSYYEVLCKVAKKLNELIENDEAQTEAIMNLKDAVEQLDTLADQFAADINDLQLRMNTAEGDIDNLETSVEGVLGSIDYLNNYITYCMYMIAPDYNGERGYSRGAYCRYNNALYKCTNDTPDPAGNFDNSYWDTTRVSDELMTLTYELEGIWGYMDSLKEDVLQNLAAEFRNYEGSSFLYLAGDVVRYGDYIYECISAYTVSQVVDPPNVDTTHWARVTLGGLISRYYHITNSLSSDIAPTYDSTLTYNTGDYCIYDNLLWKCIFDNVTGEWDYNKWNVTNVVDNLGSGGGGNGNVYVPLYDTTRSYVWGEFVTYNDDIYMCTSNYETSAGAFDPSEWARANPVSEISNSRIIETNDVNVYSAGNTWTFDVGQLVIFKDSNGVESLYKVKVQNATEPDLPVVNSMEKTDMLDELEAMRGDCFGDYVDTFDENETYNKGDIILYHDNILVCKNDNVTGQWRVQDWQYGNTVISMLAEFAKKFNNLNLYNGNIVNRFSTNVTEGV